MKPRYAPTGYSVMGPIGRSWTYATDRVGNILSITEQEGCSQPPLVLQNQTFSGTETIEHCTTLEAGTGVTVSPTGDLTLQATGPVVLSDGFSVAAGASFTAISAPVPDPVVETYAYQDVQYFLTQGDGPWGTRSWSYDRIGNRLTEAKDGLTDTYTYAQNPGGGNSPVLASVDLGVLGTKTFTHGPAGHLEQISTSATIGTTLAYDGAGRLSELADLDTTDATDLLYDGRSYLTSADGETAAVSPVYSSSGLLHSLVRPSESVHVLYFAGRPVGQVTIDGSGAETFLYYTTDHLGTPSLATDGAGGEVWSGGFEPFGRDWQEETVAGASENGVDLRLPGQWVDGSWGQAQTYNVHRWYGPGTGSYSRPDPRRMSQTRDSYAYVRQLPLQATDPLGLEIGFIDPRLKPFLDCARKNSPRAMIGINYLRDSDTPWEFRILEEGEQRDFGSGAGFMHRQIQRGICTRDCSTVEGPAGIWPFRRPGRFWIYPSDSGCIEVMDSLIHEIDERVRSLVSGRPHQEIHDEIVIPAREDAETACRECCPQPQW